MILCCKIVVVALTVVVHSMHHDRIIHVNERIGNDNEACLKENNTFCQSLEFIAEKLIHKTSKSS